MTNLIGSTWIIPGIVSGEYLLFISHLDHLEGETTYLGDKHQPWLWKPRIRGPVMGSHRSQARIVQCTCGNAPGLTHRQKTIELSSLGRNFEKIDGFCFLNNRKEEKSSSPIFGLWKGGFGGGGALNLPWIDGFFVWIIHGWQRLPGFRYHGERCEATNVFCYQSQLNNRIY